MILGVLVKWIAVRFCDNISLVWDDPRPGGINPIDVLLRKHKVLVVFS